MTPPKVSEQAELDEIARDTIHQHGLHLVTALKAHGYDGRNLIALMTLFAEKLAAARSAAPEGESEQIERAFQALEANGVPRLRARSVAGGIDVLATRMSKESRFLTAHRDDLQKVLDELVALSYKPNSWADPWLEAWAAARALAKQKEQT